MNRTPIVPSNDKSSDNPDRCDEGVSDHRYKCAMGGITAARIAQPHTDEVQVNLGKDQILANERCAPVTPDFKA